MKQSLNDIVVNELQAELDEINNYRHAVASGTESYVDPVLDDIVLTDALQKVIDYYNTKTSFGHYFDSPISDIPFEFNYAQDIDGIILDDSIDLSGLSTDVEHTKEYYDTERNK